LAKLPKVAIQYCEPKRPCTYIVGPGRHRRWEIMLSPGEDPAQMREDESVWQLLSRWLTPEDGTLWRAASYRFHALVASEWRRGRVFIAGDAAHQQPPFIGQGMCQGVRDIVNLVWKLERVLRGSASDALLDTYQVERKQHVTTLTTRIKEIGRVICERDEAAAAARDARLLAECGGVVKTVTRQEIVPPLQSGLLAADGNAVNGTLFPQPLVATDANASALLDDVVGGGWRVVVDDVALLDSGWVAAARDIGARVVVLGSAASLPAGSVAVQEKEGVLARWFEKHDCHAAIVRPDHYVWGVAGHASALASQLDALIGALS
ncbi:MAG: FAD-dependent monooxygenase, partial [Pandoraea sp.]|nr:FAD-dependent monooxygenase [Pandoraea sp.]